MGLVEQPLRLSSVTCAGQSVGGVTKISREGFSAVEAIQSERKGREDEQRRCSTHRRPRGR